MRGNVRSDAIDSMDSTDAIDSIDATDAIDSIDTISDLPVSAATLFSCIYSNLCCLNATFCSQKIMSIFSILLLLNQIVKLSKKWNIYCRNIS